jgi:hypothetical protein
MILSDARILEEIEKGTIKIVPYDRECLGSNSYDVHLGKNLATYVNKELDAKSHNEITHFEIPDEGFLLQPHDFYLGVTEEYTETHAHVIVIVKYYVFCAVKVAELPKQIVSLALTIKEVNTVMLSTLLMVPALSFTVTPCLPADKVLKVQVAPGPI